MKKRKKFSKPRDPNFVPMLMKKAGIIQSEKHKKLARIIEEEADQEVDKYMTAQEYMELIGEAEWTNR